MSGGSDDIDDSELARPHLRDSAQAFMGWRQVFRQRLRGIRDRANALGSAEPVLQTAFSATTSHTTDESRRLRTHQVPGELDRITGPLL